MAKILLTGATGYIGSHTAVELIQNGHEVLIIDNLSNSKIQALDGIKRITGIRPEFEQIDLRYKDQILDLLSRHKDIEGVIHFAAFKFVSESIQQPLKYYENNLFSSINLLSALSNYNKPISFVFSSSCTVYGIPDRLPVVEDMPMGEPTSPYGKTKMLSEYVIMDTVSQFPHIKAISLRYFNPIGAHPSLEIGESPLKTFNLVPILTEVAIGKRKEILVFGNDYPTPDGTPVRDYIYIQDLARAHVIAYERLKNKKNKKDYEYFNIGLGRGYSVLEVIKTFEKVSGRKINYRIVDRRPGDIAAIYADTKLANNELEWKPEHELEFMLKTAWEWEINKKF